MASVKRGQVKTMDTPTGQFFYFPKQVYTHGNEWERSESTDSKQEVDQGQFQNYSRALGDFMGSSSSVYRPSLGPSPFASGSSLSSVAIKNKDASPVDHMAGLTTQQSRIAKTVAVADKMVKVVDAMGKVGPRLGQVMASVKNGMEVAEKVVCELSFALKFKKCMDTNKEITDGDAIKLSQKIDLIVATLVEDVKVARALMSK